jgi:hypothetical protein
MRKIAFIVISASLSLFACVSAPAPKGEKAPPPAQALKPNLLTCAASMETAPDAEIKSVDSGSIASRYDPLPAEFGDPLVLLVKREYYQYGAKKTSAFELVYSGLRIDPALAPAKKAEVESDARLGVATGEEVLLTARSEALDPYLVACSDTLPVLEDGYWYYVPGMYMPTQMKWLSYEPVDQASFRSMYDHATDEENSRGLTLFTWWSLLKTELPEYPTAVDGGGKTECEQVIDLGGMALHLSYQSGFLKYLKDEYKLGDPIYLYLQITGIDGPKEEFTCYVRDFSLLPPEEIVERRLQSIKEGDKRI